MNPARNATAQGPLQARTSATDEWVHAAAAAAAADGSDAGARGSSEGGARSEREVESASPPAKRRREERERSRVSRACDRCKKKKTRCTGKCPCPMCMKAGLPCEFTASYTRGRVPEVFVDEEALARSKGLEGRSTRTSIPVPDISSEHVTPSTFQMHSSIASPQMSTPATGDMYSQTAEQLATADEARQDPPSRNSPEPAQTDQQGHYVGPASGVSFLLRIQKTLHQNSLLSHDSSIFNFGDAPLPEFDPTFFVLPPKADAERLVERYFDFAAPTHRFLHRPTIEGLLEEFYETQGDMRSKEEAPAKTALLLIVMAQAQAYMPHEGGRDTSARYYFASEHALSKERGAVRLTSVQARLGQCFYLLTQSRINQCWSLFGTVAHLAFAIGLNRGSSRCPSASVDYVDLESRRRLFWIAYVLDKYLSAALGRPRTFRDEDTDQELPTVVNDHELTPTAITPAPSNSYSISVMMAPVEHIKLSRILSLVIRDLYSIHPPSLPTRISLAHKYTADLHAWRAALTFFLDTSSLPSSTLIPIYQRQRNVLNLAYHHAVLLVHRSFLLSNFASLTSFDSSSHRYHRHQQTHPTPSQSSDPAVSQACERNVRACLDAAMGIVKVVDDMAATTVFRAFWFTQYYAFCAVVVLYIYRIQQGLMQPSKCEGFYQAGVRCQTVLEGICKEDCLSKRYCLVLEELRREAARYRVGEGREDVVPGLDFTKAGEGGGLERHMVQQDPGFEDSAGFYGPLSAAAAATAPIPPAAGMLPTSPENDVVYNTSFLPTSSIMADLTSWNQFEGLVTAGIGMLDSGGFPGDGGLGFGMGM